MLGGGSKTSDASASYIDFICFEMLAQHVTSEKHKNK